jgi:signal transduction histidine kinase
VIWHFRSILSRIVGLHVLAFGATSIAMPISVYFLLSSIATNFQDRALRGHASTIANYVKPLPGGRWDLDLPADLRALYAHGYNGFAFSIIDASGHLLFSSLADQTPIFPADSRLPAPAYFREPRDKTTFYGASIPMHSGGAVIWIQVAQNLQHPDVIIDDVVALFLYRVGWITIPILLTLLAIDIFIVRRALRPILDASKNAQVIEPSKLDVRLPIRDIPREILPLVSAVNQALDRLERGFRMQREFTADAAHELRTPLALLRLRVDMLGNHEIGRELRADIEGMSRIVNQLLDIAELENFVADPDDSGDLQEVCAEVVSFIAPLAISRGKGVALTGETAPVRVRANSKTLFQAIRNLVENAIGHTAPGTTVEVEVDRSGAVRVLDRGPGVPESERELIFRRFWRRDRSRVGGAGIGLAIVSRIVEAHAGRITVENRLHGGAAFALNFNLSESR